ncbi:hypothetical protein Moror_13146 [Moniliophthora roreri MCA 2997]|uniref:Uncharacterized protein n=1 Tax=Moniliophthora roreri (strain MCA 2997) TaxID=1381753 RepID=V2X5A9_MONRO|nr:hypothetical protein Moror_13146 [Moniliophthora roreri MCA 2997]
MAERSTYHHSTANLADYDLDESNSFAFVVSIPPKRIVERLYKIGIPTTNMVGCRESVQSWCRYHSFEPRQSLYWCLGELCRTYEYYYLGSDTSFYMRQCLE